MFNILSVTYVDSKTKNPCNNIKKAIKKTRLENIRKSPYFCRLSKTEIDPFTDDA